MCIVIFCKGTSYSSISKITFLRQYLASNTIRFLSELLKLALLSKKSVQLLSSLIEAIACCSSGSNSSLLLKFGKAKATLTIVEANFLKQSKGLVSEYAS